MSFMKKQKKNIAKGLALATIMMSMGSTQIFADINETVLNPTVIVNTDLTNAEKNAIEVDQETLDKLIEEANSNKERRHIGVSRYYKIEKTIKNDKITESDNWMFHGIIGETKLSKSKAMVRYPEIGKIIETTYRNDLEVSLNILNASIKKTLGYTIGEGIVVSNSQKVSIKKGEYAKCYFKNQYQRSKIVQRQYVNIDGEIYKTETTRNVYTYKALTPKVTYKLFKCEK